MSVSEMHMHVCPSAVSLNVCPLQAFPQFIYSLNNYLLSTYCVRGSKDAVVTKT